MKNRLHPVDRAAAARRTGLLLAACCLSLGCLAPVPARAQDREPGFPAPARTVVPQDPNGADAVIKRVRLDQRLNNDVPLDAQFRDEAGKSAPFGQYLGKKPVLLMLIQYRCTMLCSEEMKILAQSLKEMKFDVGKQFNVIIVSIDDRENAELASAYKAGWVKDYGRPGAEQGWHFLTGTKDNIERLAESIGYHFTYDPRTQQFAHPDGVIVLTPAGRVSKYFFRLNYDPGDMRLALVEASNNKIGTPLDAFALLCYHYDPVTGKYGLALMQLLRLASLATVLVMALGLVVMKGWDRHAKRRADDAPQASA
jgi:protein SCO1/2